MKVERLGGKDPSFEIEVKRFYVPFTITDECPKCGMTTECAETSDYFSYPTVGKKEKVSFYCTHWEDGEELGCEHEWSRNVILSIDIKAAR